MLEYVPFCYNRQKEKQERDHSTWLGDLASFDEWSIRELRAMAPKGTHTSLVEREIRKLYLTSFLPWDPVNFPRQTRAQVPSTYGKRTLVTRAFVRTAHRHGIPVDVWTMNNQQEDAGADRPADRRDRPGDQRFYGHVFRL